jgi:segregation and condensation protein A
MDQKDIQPLPQQQEMPFAIVQGEAILEPPKDLYIPPDALEVFLEAFEGPLDLLLYLIKRQNLDILDIPIAAITEQYMEYIALMKDLRLELAAEYLVMAAMLAEIKSRMLLPRPREDEENEEDPRAELIRRLQEYERFKKAAHDIDEMPRMERDYFQTEIVVPDKHIDRPLPDVDLRELIVAFHDVLRRADMFSSHHIQRINTDKFIEFTELFTIEEGRMGVVVSFMAVLELIKETLLELVQADPYGPIHVKARESHAE